MLMHIPHTLMLQGHLQEYAAASGALIATMAAETYDAIAAGDTLLKDLDLPWALQAVEQTDGSENLPSSLTTAVSAVHASGGVAGVRQEVASARELLTLTPNPNPNP